MANIDQAYKIFEQHINQHRHREATDIREALNAFPNDQVSRQVYLTAIKEQLVKDKDLDPQVRGMLKNCSILDAKGDDIVVKDKDGGYHYINQKTGHEEKTVEAINTAPDKQPEGTGGRRPTDSRSESKRPLETEKTSSP